jgi:hypothetical protein
MGYEAFILKESWARISKIADAAAHIKLVVISSCNAMGLNAGDYAFSGKRSPLPGKGPHRAPFPKCLVHIACGI